MAELQRVTSALLRNDQPRPTLTEDVPLAGLTVAAFTSGLGPWLGWQMEQGRLSAPDDAAELLALHLEHARARYARMREACTVVIAMLRDAGVGVTVLKGMHTAVEYFAEPAARPMADMDILVDDVAVAERALERAGYIEDRAKRHVRPLRAEWRTATMPALPRSLTVVHADDPYAIDLHGSLDIDFFGVYTVPFERVAAELRVPSAEWRDAFVLAQPLLAAHHAVHASHGMHGLTLIRLVELTLMLQRDMHSRADWQQLGALLRELQAERFALLSFALADRLLPGVVDATLLAQLHAAAPPRLRRAAQTLQPIDAQRLEGLALSERFLWARGVREHAQRMARMIVPTGTRGPVRRLLRIYRDRIYRVVRRQVSWRSTP
jgi:hypothetical protein